MTMFISAPSRIPPGFRFHPTEEELLQYYLRKKVACEKIDMDVIREIDLNKLEPWDIQEMCKIGSTPQNDWYFFSHKDKKYPTGTRTNRATAAGFWKATGRDKVIQSSSKRIGMRKTLVFYMGRAPHGQKSDWIMHEYRLDEITDNSSQSNENMISSLVVVETSQENGGWVVCRVFKKKHLHKIQDMSLSSSMGSGHGDHQEEETSTQMLNSSRDGALDQILQYMGRACKKQTELMISTKIGASCNNIIINNRHMGPTETTLIGNNVDDHENNSMQLPPLDSPTLPQKYSTDHHHEAAHYLMGHNDIDHADPNPVPSWAMLDRFAAFHFNGQSEPSIFSAIIQDPHVDLPTLLGGRHLHSSNDVDDLWGLTRSSSSSLAADPFCHVSRASI